MNIVYVTVTLLSTVQSETFQATMRVCVASEYEYEWSLLCYNLPIHPSRTGAVSQWDTEMRALGSIADDLQYS